MMSKKKFLPLACFALFLLVVSFLAYNKLIPTEIKMVPHYDSIGHFVLFGCLGLVAHYAFNPKRVSLFGTLVPLGPLLAILYALVDESLQVFSDNRTFDLGDLFFGVAGIVFFVTLAWFIRNPQSKDV